MRINKFIAGATGMSRRAADLAIAEGRVLLNGAEAKTGASVHPDDTVKLDGNLLELPEQKTTIMLNKPVGYVVSRDGQGSPTVYELLPVEYHRLKPIGRLDKDSSGLLLLTSDGDLANRLTHPRYTKTKVYEIKLDKPLSDTDKSKIEQGIELDDGPSQLSLKQLDQAGKAWRVTMAEGRNRQIRRTFNALGYAVTKLHRTHFGNYQAVSLKPGEWALVG